MIMGFLESLNFGGETTYQERVKAEIEHYAAKYQEEGSRKTLTESVPPSWTFVERQAQELIRKANNGRTMVEEVAFQLRAHPGGHALSIGSGPGGVELDIAGRLGGTPYEITCLDLNPDLVKLGGDRATSQGLNVKFFAQDINDLVLPVGRYDVIMCHASLHHLVNLEHIFYEMNRALKPTGEVVVVDVITRNGFRMWKETHAVVGKIWNALPAKYKLNHTSYGIVKFDEDYLNRDFGSDGMECIRSEEILPLLNEYFRCKVYVPYYSICRRFCDTMYGPNFDLSQELDLATLNFLWQMDLHLLSKGLLKPETIFAIYTKGPEGPRPAKRLMVQS